MLSDDAIIRSFFVSVEDTIRKKLIDALEPQHLEVINESHMHRGPATDSHFKVTLVTEQFEGLRLLKRHQKVYEVLKREMSETVHALALHTYTHHEWENMQSAPDSPACRGALK